MPASTHTPSARPQVRLVVDNSEKISARKAQATNEKTARSLFIACVVFIATIALIGSGPVMINAEATRSSQQSILLKQDITRATTITQNLQLERSALRSATRIEKVAREQMDMVPIGKNFIAIEIGSQSGPSTVAQKSPESNNSNSTSARDVFKNIAQLTAGEASALLVGDISLASVR